VLKLWGINSWGKSLEDGGVSQSRLNTCPMFCAPVFEFNWKLRLVLFTRNRHWLSDTVKWTDRGIPYLASDIKFGIL